MFLVQQILSMILAVTFLSACGDLTKGPLGGSTPEEEMFAILQANYQSQSQKQYVSAQFRHESEEGGTVALPNAAEIAVNDQKLDEGKANTSNPFNLSGTRYDLSDTRSSQPSTYQFKWKHADGDMSIYAINAPNTIAIQSPQAGFQHTKGDAIEVTFGGPDKKSTDEIRAVLVTEHGTATNKDFRYAESAVVVDRKVYISEDVVKTFDKGTVTLYLMRWISAKTSTKTADDSGASMKAIYETAHIDIKVNQ